MSFPQSQAINFRHLPLYNTGAPIARLKKHRVNNVFLDYPTETFDYFILLFIVPSAGNLTSQRCLFSSLALDVYGLILRLGRAKGPTGSCGWSKEHRTFASRQSHVWQGQQWTDQGSGLRGLRPGPGV